MSTVYFERYSKRDHRLCTECRARKARFSYRGRVHADRDHTLCFACFRAACDRNRAGEMRRWHSGARVSDLGVPATSAALAM